MYEVCRCTAGQRSSPYRGFDGFSMGCLLGVFPLGGPKGRFDDMSNIGQTEGRYKHYKNKNSKKTLKYKIIQQTEVQI